MNTEIPVINNANNIQKFKSISTNLVTDTDTKAVASDASPANLTEPACCADNNIGFYIKFLIEGSKLPVFI